MLGSIQNNPERPCLYVFLSKIPYNKDTRTSIVQTWGMQAQTFALRTINQELLVAREECHEVVTTFQVPLLYLKLRAAEWVSSNMFHFLSANKNACTRIAHELSTNVDSNSPLFCPPPRFF